jgi:hypothetical protein
MKGEKIEMGGFDIGGVDEEDELDDDEIDKL